MDLPIETFGALRFEIDGARALVSEPFCDWLTLTTTASAAMCRATMEHLGDRPMGTTDRGLRNYQRHDLFVSGAVISSEGRNTGNRNAVQFDGDCLNHLGRLAPVYVRGLRRLDGARATRFDLTRDVAGPSLVDDVRRAFRDEGRYTGRIEASTIYDAKGTDWDGMTLYIGAPSSLVRLRVYDRHGVTRFEFVNRKERADHVWRAFCDRGERAAWAEVVAAFGSFEGCEWWDRLCDCDGATKMGRAPRQRSLSEAVEQFRKQHGQTLEQFRAVGINLASLAQPVVLTAEKRRQFQLWSDDAYRSGLPQTKLRERRHEGLDDERD